MSRFSLDIEDLLTPLQRTLQQPDKLLRVVSASIAEEAINLIKDGFRTETDPYGDRWTPKKANDGRKTLSGVTSRLKDGWHKARVDEDGFLIAPSVTYGVYHQDPGPGSRLPRRMFVPNDERGLPVAWDKLFQETALEGIAAVFAEAMKGKAPP